MPRRLPISLKDRPRARSAAACLRRFMSGVAPREFARGVAMFTALPCRHGRGKKNRTGKTGRSLEGSSKSVLAHCRTALRATAAVHRACQGGDAREPFAPRLDRASATLLALAG